MEDLEYMELALEEARKAAEEGEVPVGAVLVTKDGKVYAAHNNREGKNDVSSHAEIEVLRLAGAKEGSWRLLGSTLYVTLEPCLMCCGAIVQVGVKRLVYGADDEKAGAVVSKFHTFDELGEEMPLLTKGLKKAECSLILKEFFQKKR